MPSKPHIYVEGSATIEVEPDEMLFSLAIAHTDIELSTAKEDVDRRSIKLIELCKEMGISREDISTTTLRVNPSYKWVENEKVFIGTTVSREIDIYLRDLAQYPEVMQAFVEAKISQMISTRLIVSQSKAVTDKALVNALKDARQRALRLAKLLGKRLGEPYSISEFMTRGSEKFSLRVSRNISKRSSSGERPRAAMAFNEPFEPGVMIARAQVFVVYLLD